MKTITLVSAALLIATAALAAEPAKKEGKIYTDQNGMTLYTFDKDEKNKSNCYDDCAKNWPPFMAPADAKAEDEWTVVERTGGTKMWAYDGKPLYTFIKDAKKGDMAGEGAGGVWHTAKAD